MLAQRTFYLLLIALFWLASFAFLARLHAAPPEQAITQMQFLPSNSSTLPALDNPEWQPVTLPHVWSDSGTLDQLQFGWYRYSLEWPQAVDPHTGGALLIWQLSMYAQLYLDGQWLGDGGAMNSRPDQSGVRNEFRPMLVTVPQPMLTPGRHELLILLRAQPRGSGFMGPMVRGTAATLEPVYHQRFLLKTTYLQLGAVLIAAIALPMGLLGLWRPHDSVYFWFAAFGLMFAMNTAILTVSHLPFSGVFLDWLFAVTINLALVSVLIFVHRFLSMRKPRLERLLLKASLLGAVTLALVAWLDPANLHIWSRAGWCTASVIMAVYPGVMIFRAYWHRGASSGFVLMVMGTLMLLLGIRDVLAINHWWVSPVEGYWTHYSVPITFLVFSYILFRRFHQALQESETLNRELVDRVRERERDIEAKHAQLREGERQRDLSAERERILLDMHDGMGGTLISTLSRLESDGEGDSIAAQSIRSAMADLRLLLFSLEPNAATLRASFAMLRDRLSAQCDDAGLQLHWDARGLPDDYQLERHETLQLMRIVQEAFTNVLKHADAGVFGVHMSVDEPSAILHVRLEDDGCGFADDASAGHGVGLRSMRTRAASFNASLKVNSTAAGTTITLSKPA